MQRHRTTLIAFTAGMMMLAGSVAVAGGSIGLPEVLEAVKTEPKLVAEIEAQLKKAHLKAEDVVCGGARHGRQWIYLGGARAAPYDCDIGKRSLTIEADRVYFDASGKPLGDVERADFKKAKTFRESNFRWTWKPNAGG